MQGLLRTNYIYIQNSSMRQAWELSAKMQISLSVKPIFLGGKKLSAGKKLGATKNKQKTTAFSSSPNIRIHSEHVHMWLSYISVAVIVNTVAGCSFHGQSLVLNAVTLTWFCAKFWQRKMWMFWQFWKIHHVCCSSCQSWWSDVSKMCLLCDQSLVSVYVGNCVHLHVPRLRHFGAFLV